MLTDTPPRAGHRSRGASARLREAFLALAEGRATILSHAEQSWASITFAGVRHRLELEFAGDGAIDAGERFMVFLPEHEFALPGQLVADAAITGADHTMLPAPTLRVRIELLVLDEG